MYVRREQLCPTTEEKNRPVLAWIYPMWGTVTLQSGADSKEDSNLILFPLLAWGESTPVRLCSGADSQEDSNLILFPVQAWGESTPVRLCSGADSQEDSNLILFPVQACPPFAPPAANCPGEWDEWRKSSLPPALASPIPQSLVTARRSGYAVVQKASKAAALWRMQSLALAQMLFKRLRA